jgi:hypothetical protein
MHTCPACLYWRDRSIFIYLFIYSVVQQPSHRVLFTPAKNNKQGHFFIPSVKFRLLGNRQEQKSL